MKKEADKFIIEKRIKMLEEYREHITHSYDLNLIDKEIIELKEMLNDFKKLNNEN